MGGCFGLLVKNEKMDINKRVLLVRRGLPSLFQPSLRCFISLIKVRVGPFFILEYLCNADPASKQLSALFVSDLSSMRCLP